MNKGARKITVTALLAALAIVLSFIESFLPALPFLPPNAKVGLSNIVTMFAAGTIGLPTALVIAVIKGVFALLTRGITAGIMSLAGGIISTGVMWFVFRRLKGSYIISGVCGSLFHNITQLGVAYFITYTSVFFYVPFVMIFGVLTGILTGTALKYCIPPLEKIRNRLF